MRFGSIPCWAESATEQLDVEIIDYKSIVWCWLCSVMSSAEFSGVVLGGAGLVLRDTVWRRAVRNVV